MIESIVIGIVAVFLANQEPLMATRVFDTLGNCEKETEKYLEEYTARNANRKFTIRYKCVLLGGQLH